MQRCTGRATNAGAIFVIGGSTFVPDQTLSAGKFPSDNFSTFNHQRSPLLYWLIGRSRPQSDAVVTGGGVGGPAINCIVCGGLARAAHGDQRTGVGKIIRETTSRERGVGLDEVALAADCGPGKQYASRLRLHPNNSKDRIGIVRLRAGEE